MKAHYPGVSRVTTSDKPHDNLYGKMKERKGLAVSLEIAPQLSLLSKQTQVNLLRIVQESLANVAAHAHAPQVSLSLVMVSGELVLTISDNGVGFDTRKMRETVPVLAGGYGLNDIARRVQDLGTHVELRFQAGQGYGGMVYVFCCTNNVELSSTCDYLGIFWYLIGELLGRREA